MMTTTPESEKLVSKKPPLPPRRLQPVKPEPPSKKRKTCDDNAQKVQKLTAINDRLNNDITDLRRLLQHEKLAVRELR